MRILLLLLFLFILTGCGPASPIPARTPTPTQPTLTTVPTAISITPSATPVQPSSNEGVPRHNAYTIQWQGLLIRLPAYAVWHEETPREALNGIPISAQGGVTYPMATVNATVELPTGPRFTMLEFAGSLDDWLQLERANATSASGNAIDETTIRTTTIAGPPAIIYQRMVTGTGDLTYAIVGIDGDRQGVDGRLLLITFEAAFTDNYLIISDLARAPATTPTTPVTATSPLEQSTAYQELAQRGHQVLKTAMTSAGIAVIFYAAIGGDKAGNPAPALSPIGVMVLQEQAGVYRRRWQTISQIESPLAPERTITAWPWTQRIFELIDLTGDSQPEIALSGCTGFGNRCLYQATVWSLNGQLLFSTSPDQFGGWQLLPDRQAIVTRTSLNIVGQAEAELHPEQWQIDWYQ